MASTIAAYLLICIYLGTDARLRTGEKARSLTIDKADRKSTRLIGLAVGISVMLLLLSPLFNHFRLGQLEAGWFTGWLGIIMMLLGIFLRFWATRVLGRFYTRTLLTTADHRIVQDGPYRLLRHPGYSGSLLVWIGAGWAANNWIVFACVTLIFCLSYLYRIQTEETMLKAKFGEEYEDYVRRTRRLIPFIY
jgi:protein-S-isoprenylcysteine O-methyltransferase Ste14